MEKIMRKLMLWCGSLLSVCMLSACNPAGSGTTPAATFRIGGDISGLDRGQSVVLKNNGLDRLTLISNGAFKFSQSVPDGGKYVVTVATQPKDEICTVVKGSGSGVTANVTNVRVVCSATTFTIGGSIIGLASGQQVTLNNNNDDPLTIKNNGGFTFPIPVAL